MVDLKKKGDFAKLHVRCKDISSQAERYESYMQVGPSCPMTAAHTHTISLSLTYIIMRG